MSSEPRLLKRRYRLLKKLGQGGMGTVWLADDTCLERAVAVKELIKDGSAADLDQARRLVMREAKALAKVQHPAIVSIYDIIVEDGDPWIVMEYINGTPLSAILGQQGPLEDHAIASYVLPVLHALAVAHRAGVVHRDVKPENILVGGDGAVWLVDFGIAQIAGATLTASGNILRGTPEYLAPERLTSMKAEPAADLWSVGIMLYYAREARLPFGCGAGLSRDAIRNEDPPRPSGDGELNQLTMQLLCKNPALRPGAAAAASVLTSILSGPTPSVNRPPRPVASPRAPHEHHPDPVNPGARTAAADRAVIRGVSTDAGAAILLALPPQRAAEILDGCEFAERARLLQGMAAVQPDAAGKVLDCFSMKDAALTLQHMKPEHAALVLRTMPGADAERTLRRLIPLDSNAAAAVIMHLPLTDAAGLLGTMRDDLAAQVFPLIWPDFVRAIERINPDLIKRFTRSGRAAIGLRPA
jgi:flagellar motility protein MotE (MotC chaperone)/predicted Ser/Thr protein kinase